MNKKTNVNVSIFIALLLTYVVPCRYVNDIAKSFGFPFGWFTVYNNTIGDIIINSTAVNVLPLLINIVIFYFAISLVSKFLNKNKKIL